MSTRKAVVKKKPKKATSKRTVTPHRKGHNMRNATQLEGQGLFGDIAKFLKKHNVISRGADIAGILGVPHAGAVGKAARTAGYGKEKNMGGGALVLPGGALFLPAQTAARRPARRAPVRKKKTARK